MSPRVVTVDPDLGPLTDDLLTSGVRVFQRAKGHRFSSDDVATAYFAARACPAPQRALDLGCGLGSVLLILAWALRDTTFCGVEAQDPSWTLLERNVARSGFADRIWIRHGDFRDVEADVAARGPFDLVTGTPPYFAADACVAADDTQREYARVEHRGGVEAYIDVGARLVAPEGALVICGDARSQARVERAAEAHGVALVETHQVIPKRGKAPLFSVWVLAHAAARRAHPRVGAPLHRTFTLRTERGETTSDADALRVFSGFPARLQSA